MKLRLRCLCGVLMLLLLAASPTSAQLKPAIRGFVIGTGWSQAYIHAFRPDSPNGLDPLGFFVNGGGQVVGTEWFFGYRPDIPQDPTTHAESAVAWGLNAMSDGGFPNGDDWPPLSLHRVYGPGPLPAIDVNGHPMLYLNNTLAWPGTTGLANELTNGITTSTSFPDGDAINVVHAHHWGGFYGVLRGSNGTLVIDQSQAKSFPWSSSGSDFGGSSTAPLFTPGPTTVNFYIYDIRGSTPTLDAEGHLTYDLTSAPDGVTPNKAVGRLTLRRKDFSAVNNIDLGGGKTSGARVIQGLWEIAKVEGTFTSVFDPVADVGKTVGTWGQPERFFAGAFYNDVNFANLVANGGDYKYLCYQFLTAHLTVTRSYQVCSGQLCVTVTNDGDVDLSNLTVSDPSFSSPQAIASLPAGTAQMVCAPVLSTPSLAGIADVSGSQFRIERSLDTTGATGLVADGTAGYGFSPSTPEPNPITIAANSNGTTTLQSCISISGQVYCDANGNNVPDAGEGDNGITVTLQGHDLNGNLVSLSTVTGGNGNYSFPNLAPSDASGYTVMVGMQSINVVANTPGKSAYASENFKLCGSVTGKVTCDCSGAPMAGVMVTLSNGQTTTTDANGNYTFSNVVPGPYTVSVPSSTLGLVGDSPTSTMVTVTAGGTATANFTYHGGTISGYAYCDANGNGTFDAGDHPLQGVTITLKDSMGNTIATAVTDVNGFYSFSCCLAAGTYTVSAPPTAGGGKLLTPSPLTVVLPAGGTMPNNNFGYDCNNASISGTVSCTQTGTPIAGVTVTLSNGQTTMTDSSGNYSFTNLPSGMYTVSVPASFNGAPLATPSPLSVTVGAGKTVTGINFGYTCATGPGPTRTWGFWKTHLDVFTQVVNGGCINLGVLTVTSAQSPPHGGTEDLTHPPLGVLEAIFWTSPGKGTTALGQARLSLAHQLIAALANTCFLGTSTGQNGFSASLVGDAINALDGTDTTLMNTLEGELDSFNGSGDNISFPAGKSEGKADPNGAKALATDSGPAFK